MNRYIVKHFDKNQKVSYAKVNTILDDGSFEITYVSEFYDATIFYKDNNKVKIDFGNRGTYKQKFNDFLEYDLEKYKDIIVTLDSELKIYDTFHSLKSNEKLITNAFINNNALDCNKVAKLYSCYLNNKIGVEITLGNQENTPTDYDDFNQKCKKYIESIIDSEIIIKDRSARLTTKQFNLLVITLKNLGYCN